MARQNVAVVNPNRTHEGGMAAPSQSPMATLERTVVNCLLFENTFYEGADSIAKRIEALVPMCPAEKVAALAVRTRTELGLRHVSLWVARCLARSAHGKVVADTVEAVIARADELAEFLTLYWRDGRMPISAPVKRGLAKAFRKFSPYALAKYNRDDAIKLRDVMFMVHPKPLDEAQAEAWKALAAGTLESPDTWEVALSSGADKRETWERLLREDKLGALALLRNLRNMETAGVDRSLVMDALHRTKAKGVLPFQFVAASRFAPAFSRGVETAMLNALEGREPLGGTTGILIDVSGSMDEKLSGKSQLNRIDAACALAILLAETGDVRVWTFSNSVVEVQALRGFGLVDAIYKSQPHGSTYLAGAVAALAKAGKRVDRFIVVTDEQSHDGNAATGIGKSNYLVNVAPYQPGLDVSAGWVRINGFSERLADWIRVHESEAA